MSPSLCASVRPRCQPGILSSLYDPCKREHKERLGSSSARGPPWACPFRPRPGGAAPQGRRARQTRASTARRGGGGRQYGGRRARLLPSCGLFIGYAVVPATNEIRSSQNRTPGQRPIVSSNRRLMPQPANRVQCGMSLARLKATRQEGHPAPGYPTNPVEPGVSADLPKPVGPAIPTNPTSPSNARHPRKHRNPGIPRAPCAPPSHKPHESCDPPNPLHPAILEIPRSPKSHQSRAPHRSL